VDYVTLEWKPPRFREGVTRIRLATQIGTSRVASSTSLKNPTIGLPSEGQPASHHTLKLLRISENTLIEREHDEQTIRTPTKSSILGPGQHPWGKSARRGHKEIIAKTKIRTSPGALS
jgi:excinuclease UvrABC ATPase subunit